MLMLFWLIFLNNLQGVSLSQLQPPTSPDAEQPHKAVTFSWGDFVHVVLSLTIQAYQTMYEKRTAKQSWEENVFTINLASDLRKIAFVHGLIVHTRWKIHTTEMFFGEQPTIQAKEIDLSLVSWEGYQDELHFVWEAKRVGDKKAYSNLSSEYVNEGIYRFIDNEYAEGLNDAGMLGYVLSGNVVKIVGDINDSMGRISTNLPLPETDHLQLTHPIIQFQDVYQSRHTRIDNTTITLHHLFLTFDFS